MHFSLSFNNHGLPFPQASVSTVQLWVSGVLAILRVLISQSTEDIVLSRVQELALSPHLVSCPVISRLRDGDSSSAVAEHSEGRQVKNLPEETFSRYAAQPTLFLTPGSCKSRDARRPEREGRLVLCSSASWCGRPLPLRARPRPAAGPQTAAQCGRPQPGRGPAHWTVVFLPFPPGWLSSRAPHGTLVSQHVCP